MQQGGARLYPDLEASTKSSSSPPVGSDTYSRSYDPPAGPQQSHPMHNAYMEKQIEALAAGVKPQQTQPQAQQPSSMFRLGSSSAVSTPAIHPSMVPGNTMKQQPQTPQTPQMNPQPQPGVMQPQPPPNFYNPKAAAAVGAGGPAKADPFLLFQPTQPAQQQAAPGQTVSMPVLQTQTTSMAPMAPQTPNGRAEAESAPLPVTTTSTDLIPDLTVSAQSLSQSQQTPVQPLPLPQQDQQMPQEQPKQESLLGDAPQQPQQPKKDADPGFVTPTKQTHRRKVSDVPPIPPRLLNVDGTTGRNSDATSSPQAFGGQSPAPKPGEILLPINVSGATGGQAAAAGAGGGQQFLPPVPPRSPKVNRAPDNANNNNAELLIEFRSPTVPKRQQDQHQHQQHQAQQQQHPHPQQQQQRQQQHNHQRRPSNKELLSLGDVPPPPKDDWEVDASELVFEKEIAVGTFGSVWKGQFMRTPCAIKKLHGAQLSQRQLQEFYAEVAIMKKLRHPNIVLFMGFCSDKESNSMYMIFEFMEKGSLWGIIHDKRVYITQPMRVRMAQDIARGLYYLHSLKPPILHRDIKSPNILADGALTLKVADFGLSKTKHVMQETMTSQTGTYQYMAPEVIQGTDYSLKADVFSYGVVLWELLARLPPYPGVQPMTLAFKVVNEGLRPPVPAHADAQYSHLMQQCWAANPELRPTFGFVLDALATMVPKEK